MTEGGRDRTGRDRTGRDETGPDKTGHDSIDMIRQDKTELDTTFGCAQIRCDITQLHYEI